MASACETPLASPWRSATAQGYDAQWLPSLAHERQGFGQNVKGSFLR